MCERTYVACGGCDAKASENVRMVGSTVCYESWTESVDEDGDACGDREYGDSEPGEDGDWHYECSACGWTGSNLDHECSADDCDCSECEPEIDNYDDPDQIVTLVRANDHPVANNTDWPVEVQRLMLDRSIHFIPMRRERACEIDAEVEFSIGINNMDHYPYGAGQPRLYFNTNPQLADWIIEQLSIPEPEDERPAHIPGQLALEGGSRVS